ncbi:hypothetical protein [Streptomyces sp. NPDC059063]|uniref:hypothetical protein n=1 Tax=unclassified Streptomyces TaxID=2593676 RepID=UPI00369E76F3
MTVAHEEPYEPHDDVDEGAGVDALMLAVTDAPVPEEARDDEEFLAEYAAAVADVAALREQLRAAGDALARRPEGEAAAERPPAPRPARALRTPAGRRRALLALAATLAAGLLGGTVWLGARGDIGAGDDLYSGGGDDGKAFPESGKRRPDPHSGTENDSASQSPEGYVACARLVVEGTVESVEPLPGGVQDRITLDVSRSYKPAKAPDEVTFVMDVNVDPRLEAGDRALIGIPKGEESPDIWSTGKQLARERRWIVKALPKARALEAKGVEC